MYPTIQLARLQSRSAILAHVCVGPKWDVRWSGERLAQNVLGSSARLSLSKLGRRADEERDLKNVLEHVVATRKWAVLDIAPSRNQARIHRTKRMNDSPVGGTQCHTRTGNYSKL